MRKMTWGILKRLFNSVTESVLSGGINVIDNSINFRYQKSERITSLALSYLSSTHSIPRNELFLITKGGLLTEDYSQPNSIETITKKLISDGILSQDEIIGTSCLNPKFIEFQFESSLVNLGVSSVDLYLLNLPDIRLTKISKDQLFNELLVLLEDMLWSVWEEERTWSVVVLWGHSLEWGQSCALTQTFLWL